MKPRGSGAAGDPRAQGVPGAVRGRHGEARRDGESLHAAGGAAPRARGGARARRRQSLSHAEPAAAARSAGAPHECAGRHGDPARQRLGRADPDADHGARAAGRGDDVSVADLRDVLDGRDLQRHARRAGAAARRLLARRRCVRRAHAGGKAGAGVSRLPEQSDRRALSGRRCRARSSVHARAWWWSTRPTTCSPARASCRGSPSSTTWW